MRKPVYAICEQQRCRSASAHTRSLINAFVIRYLDIVNKYPMTTNKPIITSRISKPMKGRGFTEPFNRFTFRAW